jgi:hypothetical protein
MPVAKDQCGVRTVKALALLFVVVTLVAVSRLGSALRLLEHSRSWVSSHPGGGRGGVVNLAQVASAPRSAAAERITGNVQAQRPGRQPSGRHRHWTPWHRST